MHERGAVARAVTGVIQSSHGRRPLRVELELGPDVHSSSVELYWREFATDTIAADAVLSFGVALDELVCLLCHGHFRGSQLTICPRCGGDGLVVDAAPEVAIAEIVFSDQD